MQKRGKQLLVLLSIFFFLFFLSLPNNKNSIQANPAEGETIYYDQDFDLCYTGCAGWKFYWAHDPVWDYVKSQCALDGTDMAKILIKYAFNTVRTSADFGPFIQSIFCAGAVKLNLKPKLDNCRRDCEADIWTYAPDLFVDRGPQGVIYSQDKHQLQIKVINGGYVYTPAFKVDVYAASTDKRDCQISNADWEKIGSYTVKELAPINASRHIAGIPHQDVHSINWEAQEDECNKIKIMVDPDNRIPELDEANGNGYGTNNTYFYTINNLPNLPHYQISDIKHHFLDDNLDGVVLNFEITNHGELLGKPKIEVRDCYGDKTLRAAKTLVIGSNDSQKVELTAKDLFWPKDPIYFRNLKLCITASDENDSFSTGTEVLIFSGSIRGRVLDMTGQPVAGATVTLNNGEKTSADEKGNYYFSGLTKQGKYIVTASSEDHDQEASREVQLSLNPNPYTVIQPKLHPDNVDIILFDNPASLTINCPFDNYLFRLNGQHFSYQGSGQSASEKLSAIVPGNYQLILFRFGYNTKVFNINLKKSEEKRIDCNLKPLKVYGDDSGIDFKPTLNDLWDFTPANDFHLLSASISRDGSTVFMALGNSHTQEVKLFIFNRSGQKLAETALPEMAAYDKIFLEPSYDGSSVLVNAYLVFNRQGKIVSRRSDDKGLRVPANLSWQGDLICDFSGLYDGNFNPLYTGAWGQELDKPHTRCRFGQFASFTANNQIISQCEKVNDGLCRLSFWDGSQYPLLKLATNGFWHSDVSVDGKRLLVTITQDGQDKAVYAVGKKIVWQQPIEEANGRVSLSPAGNYAVVLSPHGKDYGLFLFNSEGRSLIDLPDPTNGWKWKQDFYDVRATGQGIFYVRYDGKIHFGVLGRVGQASKENLDKILSGEKRVTKEKNKLSKKEKKNKNTWRGEVNQQTKSALGHLWEKVKQFLNKIFPWFFK